MSANIINIEAGQKYGRWTVAATGLRNGGKRASLCICECGNEGVVNNSSLHLGKSMSCGCLRSELLQWKTVPKKPDKQDSGNTRLVELTDTRHNANDGIGSGVRLPRGMSSMAMV